MRVTLKLLLWFLVCVVLGLGLNAVLAVRTELSRYEATLSERHEVMGKVLRAAFVEVVTVDPANVVAYWPGGIPGPPGFEWYSNRAVVGVRVSKAGLTDAQFFAKRAAVVQALDALLPAWMTYVVGVGSEFVVGQGVVGQTLL
jgi:hypothetical protein